MKRNLSYSGKLILAAFLTILTGTSAACSTTSAPAIASIPTQPPPASVSPAISAPGPESLPGPVASSSPTGPAGLAPSGTKNTLRFGSRTLTNNIWGAPPDEILTSEVYLNRDFSFGWDWSREEPKLNPGRTLFQPIFPNVRIGGDSTTRSSSLYFPIKTGDIRTLNFDVAYKYLTVPTGSYNLAYEMFLSDDNQPLSNQQQKAEIMIWIHSTFTQPPSTFRGDFTDGKNKYHLYSWHKTDGSLYASFIMDGSPQLQGQHTVDAKMLLDHLELDPNWYLRGVELGNEIVFGSGKIEIDNLNVNVNGNDA
jgi:hypothetical protein